MGESNLVINLVIDKKVINVPYCSTTTAEDICVTICKQLNIGPVARHLFGLRVTGKQIFLMPSATFMEKNFTYDFRIRFKPASIEKLKRIDIKAYDYYFHQARNDLLENKIPDIVFDKCRRELVGLGVTDMYRVMLEKDITKEIVENDYRKYMPKEVMKRHSFFVKKPVKDTLEKIRSGHDVWYVKAEYLKQLDSIAPEYLSEEYKAVTDREGSIYNIHIKVSPFHPTEPGLRIAYESKKDRWEQICKIEDLCHVSIRQDGTVEVNRKNGIPFYLKLNSLPLMYSFVSLLDGYYRLTCKWTFNLCKDVQTPSLQRLYSMRCHGPVGGEFSYAKLEEKRGNYPGCFILRESETKYNIYFLDVCIKGSSKPKTFKLERLPNNEFIFNDDLTKYKSTVQLIQAYNDPNGSIYLQECLPPSEYDNSPLLLCQTDSLKSDSLTDSISVSGLIPSTPLCINSRDIQVYKGRKCLKWSKDRKKVKHKDSVITIKKFPKHQFPDETVGDAKKYCRNPDGDISGPWCFVNVEDSNEVEKEYCDIPFCEDVECTVFSKEVPTYSLFSDFNPKLTNFTFGLRLWDSDSFLNASARLLLSVLALPVTGKDVKSLGIGIEIHITSKGAALTYGNKDEVYYESLSETLTSENYSFFTLNWDHGIISLNKEGIIKPIFLAEIETKNNLLGFHKDSFYYYSAMGNNIFWSFPFCDDDDICDVHTTTSNYYQQFWPLEKSDLGFELKLFIRAFHSAYILLIPSPAVKFPSIELRLDQKNGLTNVIFHQHENASYNVLLELKLNEMIIDYWKWSEFSLSIFSDILQFHSTSEVGTLMVFELQHDVMKQLRWFSPASKDTVAHWTFFCAPSESAKPPPAVLPECALDEDEQNYQGTQDLTDEGLQCLPWSGKNIKDNFFSDKESVLKAKNYCRNPIEGNKGTFCYVFTPTQKIEKRSCHIRRCKSEECRLAGTGNDYVGHLSITRSNRTCVAWLDTDMGQSDFNESLFADKSMESAKNYCRNPTRNLAGSWCFTEDKEVGQDICNVKDCDKPEESIIIVRKRGTGTEIFILPQWKEEGIHGGLRFSVKQWNPDQEVGLVFEFRSLDKEQSMQFVINHETDKVEMFYNSYLVKEKTFAHLIHSGKWVAFKLQVRKGEIIFGYDNVQTAFFEWTHDSKETTFEPVFLSYTAFDMHPLGMFFHSKECHTENVTANEFLKVMPLGIWKSDNQLMYRDISFNLRGTGSFNILLVSLPDFGLFHLLQLENKKGVTFSKINFFVPDRLKQLKSEMLPNPNFIQSNSWVNLKLSFTESDLFLTSQNSTIFSYHSSEPLIFYWFSVGVENGWITWTANCDPPDIDGPPLDGGWSEWSPWHCTVSCGGGEGFRTRRCNNPQPNILGQLCHGSSTSSGTCNDFPCGEISDDTFELVQETLRTKNFSLVVNEGDSVIIENNYDILERIAKESPQAEYEWTLNGLLLEEDKKHVTLRNKSIYINEVSKVNAGIYAYVLKRVNKQRLIIQIVSLAVISIGYDISVRVTQDFVLHSNAVPLEYVYKDLKQEWLLNNNTYIDYGIISLSAASVEHLKYINMSHAGEWRCIVEQSELELSWITNIVKINVKKAPNFYIHLMEDKLTAPLFGWLKTENNVRRAIICSIVITFAFVFICLLLYLKFGHISALKKRAYKRNRRL